MLTAEPALHARAFRFISLHRMQNALMPKELAIGLHGAKRTVAPRRDVPEDILALNTVDGRWENINVMKERDFTHSKHLSSAPGFHVKWVAMAAPPRPETKGRGNFDCLPLSSFLSV